MKEIRVRMSDAMAAALSEQIARHGHAGQRGAEATLMRELLYVHLAKAGHSASQLAMDDAEYQKHQKIAGDQLPEATRRQYENV